MKGSCIGRGRVRLRKIIRKTRNKI